MVQEPIPPFEILVKDLNSREKRVLSVEEVYTSPNFKLQTPCDLLPTQYQSDLSDIPKKHLRIAHNRYRIIEFLLNSSKNAKQEAATKEGYGILSIYRWIKAYKQSGLRGLVPGHHNRRPCQKTRFSEMVENIIKTVLENEWANLKRLSMKEIYRIIEHRCQRIGVTKMPTYNTICLRIQKRSKDRDMLKRRGKKDHANQYEPTPGVFAARATHSLQYVQIDHKLMDVIIVDSKGRVIGRPWLTLGIDIFSRAIWGIFLGFNHPSSMSVSMCLYNGIEFKKTICEKHALRTPWPVYGIPEKIHVDNGKEFHSDHLEAACAQLGIKIDYRKPHTPRHGGVVERFFRTLDQKLVNSLEGKTFSNSGERGEYFSEKEACLTLEDLEKAVSIFIVEQYQEEFHTGIQTTPNKKWEEGIQIAQPCLPRSQDDLKLFLMKEDKRIINRTGIVFNGIRYWDASLIPHIREDASFRYDPRSLSRIYVSLPGHNQFIDVPARLEDSGLAGASLWEIRKVKKLLYGEKMRTTPTNNLMARERLEQIRRDATQRSKKARKEQKILESHTKAFKTSSAKERQTGSTRATELPIRGSNASLQDYEMTIDP